MRLVYRGFVPFLNTHRGLFELLKSSVMPTVGEVASKNLFSALSLFSVRLCIYVRAAHKSTVVPDVSLDFSMPKFSCLCLVYAWERTCDDILSRFWPLSHTHCIFSSLRPWQNGRADGNPFGSHLAAISRKPMSRNSSRRYIPLRQRGLSLTDQLRHPNVTVKTSIHGFDVPTNFRSKKCSPV